MPVIRIPIAEGLYQSESPNISSKRAVNCYANVPQTRTITEDNVFGTPGLDQILSVSTVDTGRGSHEMGGIYYAVIGNFLYRLNRLVDAFGVESFTTDNLGAINGDGPVSMANNGTQLCIVAPGVEEYIFTESPDTLVAISDPNFDGPMDSVEYADGFFTFVKTGKDEIQNSPIDDGRGSGNSGAAYDALDFLKASADPDSLVGQIFYGNRLYAIGTQTTQPFQNIARSPGPFEPVPVVYDKGAVARFGIIEDSTSFVMVGKGQNEQPAIYKFNGNGFTKISPTGIDRIIGECTPEELADITTWSYSEDGAFFIGFQLPNTCIVYEEITQRWHERQSIKGSDDVTYRVASMASAYNRIIVTDTVDGRIGVLDKEIYKEYGGFIKRKIITRPFDNMGSRTAVAYIEAVMETGVARYNETIESNGNTLDVDPEQWMRLSWSDDGGHVYGPEIPAKAGKQGERGRRVMWRRLGSFPRSRTLMFEYSDPYKFVLIKAEASVN
jgi:hypothetical protein